MKKNTCGAVIVAAGSGRRMKLDANKKTEGMNKIFLRIGEKTVLEYVIEAFEESREVDKVVIVTREEDIALCSRTVKNAGAKKVMSIVRGGSERQESVMAGIREISGVCDFCAIHDGARCLIEPEDIDSVICEAYKTGAASLAMPCYDSLRKTDGDGFIESDIDRKNVYLMQTPQVFGTDAILKAHERAKADGFSATDDCSVAVRDGVRVAIVPGKRTNIKLTEQSDIEFIELLLGGRNL